MDVNECVSPHTSPPGRRYGEAVDTAAPQRSMIPPADVGARKCDRSVDRGRLPGLVMGPARLSWISVKSVDYN